MIDEQRFSYYKELLDVIAPWIYYRRDRTEGEYCPLDIIKTDVCYKVKRYENDSAHIAQIDVFLKILLSNSMSDIKRFYIEPNLYDNRPIHPTDRKFYSTCDSWMLTFVEDGSLVYMVSPAFYSVLCKNGNEEYWDEYNDLCKCIEEYNKEKYPDLKINIVTPEQYSTQHSGGCYIATAVYGSYDCPEVWTLRRFRDNKLSQSFLGNLFIRFYYFVSPTIVKLFGRTKWFNSFWKKRLDKFVMKLKSEGFEDTPYNDK